ncbi:MAG: YHS domain-containing protein [Verrucomicrobia subdivision 3 bacterium]|nr:YHS domain-containing protein [Limisphaerales bacterium]
MSRSTLGSLFFGVALQGLLFAVSISPLNLQAAPIQFSVQPTTKAFERSQITELKEDPASIRHYNLGADKVALKGYDPVAYFTSNQALKGRKEISVQYRGVTYWFASDKNKELFLASPEKYLPTYGGWCATAMAKGEKVEIDPTNFKVTNGRLFVFFKAFYANALKEWNKDEANLTVKADANWRRISGE